VNDFGLPPGWEVRELREVAEVRLGRQRSPSRAQGPNMRKYVRAANVTWNGVDVSDVKEMDFDDKEFGRFQLRDGDLLIVEGSGSATEVGKPAVWRGEVADCCFQNTLIRVRADSELVPWLLKHFQKDAKTGEFARASRGIGIHHIGSKTLEKWKVSLPPLPDQRRIVARIESLQARSRRAKEALDAIPPLLERFRQSVLAAAFRGDLTADWRRKNPDVEPASVLLERIRAERKRRWIAAEAEKARSKAEAKAERAAKPWTEADDRKALEAGRKRAEKRYKEPEPVDPDGLPELPEGWCWASLDSLSVQTSVGHVGPTSKHYCEEGEGVPFVRSQNVRPGRFDPSGLRSITPKFHGSLKKSQLRGGELLVVRVGANRGDTCLLPPGLGEINCANIVFSRVDSRVGSLAALYCQSPSGRRRLLGMSTGSAQGVINTKSVASLLVPVPPAAEAREVLTRVDTALDGIAAARSPLESVGDQVRSLDAAVLARAFRGEL
jgi:type I restriction enzyme, S subunit